MSKTARDWIFAALLSGIASAAFAQEAPSTKPHIDPRPQYAKLADLPDWSGVWSPDWGLTARNRGITPQLTPAGAALSAAYKASQEKGENLQTQAANCVPPGLPGLMSQPYPIEFMFRPGAVYIITETYSQVRRVYTDGSPLPEDPDLWFNGHSIGHWEGETLIVETNGLNPQNVLVPGIRATEQTRLREKIWSEAPGQLTIETTITDPTYFTQPFVTRSVFSRKSDWEMREFVCAENNKDGADADGRPMMNLD
jgi:hypothetical protein